MRIDDFLRAKLVKAVEEAGGAHEFSLRCGVNAGNISRYLSGKISSINDNNWEKLSPFLEDGTISHLESAGESEFIRSTPELAEILQHRMKERGIVNIEELRLKINGSSYEQLRRQMCGKLNWFSDTLGAVAEALELEISRLPLSPPEKQIIERAMMKRGSRGIMRLLPVIGGCFCALTPGADGVPELKTAKQVPVAQDDRRNLRAFKLSGSLMEPTLLDSDIVIVEVADDPGKIPANALVVVRLREEFAAESWLCCGRFHLYPDQSVVISFDFPGGGIIRIPAECVCWSGIVRHRISDFS